MRPFFAALLALFASATAFGAVRTGRPPQVAPILTTPEAHDAHSFARPEVARVTHVALDLDADFEAHRMAGTATLDIQAARGAEIVLDSQGLECLQHPHHRRRIHQQRHTHTITRGCDSQGK